MRFFNEKDSLLHITLNKIKDQNTTLYNDVFKSKKSERIILCLTDYNAYKFLILFILLAILSCTFDYRQLEETIFGWLNLIYLDFEKSKNLLDQRISNVATIIGVSLTISTILINNLAEKKKENYTILFQQTFIFPIVYYALGVLIFLLFFSLIRDSILDRFQYIFINAVIIGHYLIFFLLGSIAYLFSQLIKFFNPQHLKDSHTSRFQRLVKKVFFNEIIELTSTKVYNETLSSSIQTFSYNPFEPEDNQILFFENMEQKNLRIKDIKINSLIKLVNSISSSYPQSIFFDHTGISINQLCSSSKAIFKLDNNIPPKKKDEVSKLILKCFKTYNLDSNSENERIFKAQINEISEKLNLYAEQGNIKELEKLLELYNFIYELYIDNINVEPNYSDNKNSNILNGRDIEIYESIVNALEKKKLNSADSLIDFCSKIFTFSIGNGSYKIFNQYLRTGVRLYLISKQDAAQKKYLLEKSINFTITELYHIRFSPNSNRVILNDFVYQLYSQTSLLIYHSLEPLNNNNFIENDFELIMTEFNEINSNSDYKVLSNEIKLSNLSTKDDIKAEREKIRLENVSLVYFRHILLATKSWVYFLFYCKKIDYKLFQKLISKINYNPSTPEILISEFITIVEPAQDYSRWYLNFGNWDIVKRPVNKVYTPLIPEEWLSIGFTVMNLSYNIRANINFTLLDNLFIFNRLNSNIYSAIDNIEKDIDHWLSVLNCQTKEEFQKRKNTFISILKQITKLNNLSRKEEIAKSPISDLQINEFKKAALRNWKSSFNMLSIFELFNNVQTTHITIEDSLKFNPFIGYHDLINKENFIGYNIISNISQYGTWAGGIADEYFLESVMSDKSITYKTSSSIYLAILLGIETLREKQIQPNVIILPLEFSYTRANLESIPNFERVWQNPSERKTISQIGVIEDILVFGLRYESFKKNIIIADFKKAFTLEFLENDSWMDNRLILEVKELNQEQRDKLFREEKEKDDSKSDDEIKLDIDNLLDLEIGCLIKYHIMNKEAITIISIEQEDEL